MQIKTFRRNWGIWPVLATLVVANVAWMGMCQRGQREALRPAASRTPSAAPSLAKGVQFEKPDVQLGEIRGGLPLACEFAFTNAGPNVVELVEARPGCGCLKPHLDKTRIGPGEPGVVPLEVQTLGQAAGPHTWHLTVLFRDGEQIREQLLQITARVVTEVSVQPATLTVVTEGNLSHEITVTDLRPRPLRILAVESTCPQLKAEAGPFSRDAFGNFTSKIKIEANGELAAGRHDEQLVIHTDDPLYGELRIPCTVVKQAGQRITATPSELTLQRSALVRLCDRQDEPVVVDCVTSSNPGLICQWAPGPEQQATLNLQLKPSRLPRDGTAATVHVHISSPVREMVAIAVRWDDD